MTVPSYVGCDWPWAGLYHHCNVFDAFAKLKCPWNDVAAGTLSMLAVFGASISVASRRGLSAAVHGLASIARGAARNSRP
jgi:hypothetical protein